jgi:hypothetical protein
VESPVQLRPTPWIPAYTFHGNAHNQAEDSLARLYVREDLLTKLCNGLISEKVGHLECQALLAAFGRFWPLSELPYNRRSSRHLTTSRCSFYAFYTLPTLALSPSADRSVPSIDKSIFTLCIFTLSVNSYESLILTPPKSLLLFIVTSALIYLKK